MHDLPRQKLAELLAKYGHGLCDDPKRLEALLKDVLRNEHKRETFVLVNASREGIAKELRSSASGLSMEVLIPKLVRQLCQDLALDEGAAQWSVESWAFAMNGRFNHLTTPKNSQTLGVQTVPPTSDIRQVEAYWSITKTKDVSHDESAAYEINKDVEAVHESIQTFGTSKYFMQQVSSDRVAIWRNLAERGESKAQWLFGDWFFECNPDQSDFSAAESWWIRSANGGFARAYSSLGSLCQNGLSTNFGKEHAVDWFRKGVEAQEATATLRLARCFQNGQGVETDDARAVELLERSTELGFRPSAVALAHCLQQGIGVAKNKGRAATLLHQAADSGSRHAQYLLGLSCLVSSRDTAIEWLDASARRGHRGAITKLEELGLSSHRVTWTNPNGIEFCLLEPGNFQMGTKDLRGLGCREFADEMPLHPVTLCQPFWIGRYAITQEQYHSVTGKNPANFKGLWPGKWKRRPVDSVAWIEAVKFCNALSSTFAL